MLSIITAVPPHLRAGTMRGQGWAGILYCSHIKGIKRYYFSIIKSEPYWETNFLRNVGWLGKYDIASAFQTFAPYLVQIDKTKGKMIDNTITVLRKHKQS